MTTEKQVTVSGGGAGFLGLLTIAFIVLKLCGVIDWSWFWVLSPLLIPTLLAFFLFAVIGIITLVAASKRKK